MFGMPPYALIVDRDEAGRARMGALLRERGFVAAAFRDGRAALTALAVRPVDIAIVAGEVSEGADALAIAQQMRDCEPSIKVLFAGSAEVLPAAPGPRAGHAVTHPFDKRRFLSAVFELLARGRSTGAEREAAEFGLMAARLACLRGRLAGYGDALDVHPVHEPAGAEAIA